MIVNRIRTCFGLVRRGVVALALLTVVLSIAIAIDILAPFFESFYVTAVVLVGILLMIGFELMRFVGP